MSVFVVVWIKMSPIGSLLPQLDHTICFCLPGSANARQSLLRNTRSLHSVVEMMIKSWPKSLQNINVSWTKYKNHPQNRVHCFVFSPTPFVALHWTWILTSGWLHVSMHIPPCILLYRCMLWLHRGGDFQSPSPTWPAALTWKGTNRTRCRGNRRSGWHLVQPGTAGAKAVWFGPSLESHRVCPLLHLISVLTEVHKEGCPSFVCLRTPGNTWGAYYKFLKLYSKVNSAS